jgi:hypothetical protein
MSPRVVVYQVKNHHRSTVICNAMAEGLRRHGIEALRRYEFEYTDIEGDIAVFYGLEGRLRRVFRDYSEKARAAYIDLGYWKRKEPNARFDGYHKIVINDRHPTSYFQSRQHDDSRSKSMGIEIKPWNPGHGHILLAGMGDKAADAEGYDIEEWERWAIKKIRAVSKRSIVYRPKPSWKGARPIAGVGYSPKTSDLSSALRNCYAVVTHHSNVAVEALCTGIPAWCWKGVATPLASQDLSRIEHPIFPDGREQWVNDIAWCQWNVAEMRSGLAWTNLQEEGLL